MSSIKSRDTSPELIVRKAAYRLGYRYRLHVKDLPGKPDLVFTSRRKIIFVHGCFWHQHPQCREGRLPGSNQQYWSPKLARNVERDLAHQRALTDSGWKVLVVWECSLGDPIALENILKDFLDR